MKKNVAIERQLFCQNFWFARYRNKTNFIVKAYALMWSYSSEDDGFVVFSLTISLFSMFVTGVTLLCPENFKESVICLL